MTNQGAAVQRAQAALDKAGKGATDAQKKALRDAQDASNESMARHGQRPRY